MSVSFVVLKVSESNRVIVTLGKGVLPSLEAQPGHAARKNIVCFRIGILHMTSNLLERRWEKWQARNGDTQQRFQYRHNANFRDSVGEILKV